MDGGVTLQRKSWTIIFLLVLLVVIQDNDTSSYFGYMTQHTPCNNLYNSDSSEKTLVCIWQSDFEIGDSYGYTFVTGDSTNDGVSDITIADQKAGLIYIIEWRGNELVNTFNVSESGISVDGDSIVLGDLDGDGLNEYVIGGYTSSSAAFYVFRNDSRISSNVFSGIDDGISAIELGHVSVSVLPSISSELNPITSSSDSLQIITGLWYTPTVYFWEQDGRFWTQYYTFNAKERPVSDIVMADVDGDGFDELLLAEGGGTIEIIGFSRDGAVVEYELEHPMLAVSTLYCVQSLAVGDFDNDGGSAYEIFSCIDGPRTATVWKKESSTFEPIFNIELPGLPDAIATGNLDDDDDIELVVAAGYSANIVMLYEFDGETWQYSANFTDFDESNQEIHHMEIADVDNDGQNELVVAYGKEPLRVLEYTTAPITTSTSNSTSNSTDTTQTSTQSSFPISLDLLGLGIGIPTILIVAVLIWKLRKKSV